MSGSPRVVVASARKAVRQTLFARLRATGCDVSQAGSFMELARHLAEHDRGERGIDLIIFAPTADRDFAELEALGPGARGIPVVLIAEAVPRDLDEGVVVVDPGDEDGLKRLEAVVARLVR